MCKIRTIQQVLQGLAPHRAQTLGNMTVIPLVSDIVDDTIVSPDALEMETVNYGTVLAFPFDIFIDNEENLRLKL